MNDAKRLGWLFKKIRVMINWKFIAVLFNVLLFNFVIMCSLYEAITYGHVIPSGMGKKWHDTIKINEKQTTFLINAPRKKVFSFHISLYSGLM